MTAGGTLREQGVVVPARRHRRRGLLLIGLGVFQWWLWGTRIVNLLQDADSFAAAFVGVHVALYTVAIIAGTVLVSLGWRQVGEARRPGGP